MKRALITGATGFTGRALRRALEASGVEVHAASARGRGGDGGDLRSPTVWRTLLTDARPDVVFHLHGTSDPEGPAEAVALNVRPAAALLRAAAALGYAGTVLLAGSAAEYGPVDAEALPVGEDAPLHPTSWLGRSKAVQTRLGLRAAARRGVRVVIARPTNLVGPGAPPTTAVGAFAARLAAVARGEASAVRTGPLDVARDLVDVRDAVAAYVALATCPRAVGRVVNVATGRAVPMRAVLAALMEAMGVTCPVHEDPALAPARSRGTRVFAADPARLVALTGWTPRTPLAATLRDVAHDALAAPPAP